jgi:hypothetical protein
MTYAKSAVISALVAYVSMAMYVIVWVNLQVHGAGFTLADSSGYRSLGNSGC